MQSHQDLTFLIAGDSSVSREACKIILSRKEFHVLGKASDANEAVRMCGEVKPDIAVLQDSMRGMDVLEAARLIKLNCLHTRVLILTADPTGPQLLESLVVGASAYISESKAVSCLLDAVEAVGQGETYVRATCNGHERSVRGSQISVTSKPIQKSCLNSSAVLKSE